MFSDERIDTEVRSYVECAIWAGLDWDRCDRWDEHEEEGCTRECVENGNPAKLEDNYSEDDVADEALVQIRRDLSDFMSANEDDLDEWDEGQIGHDFYLTRNGHGTGFWDRGKEAGDRLSKACKAWGESDLYGGDDGRLYAS